MDMVGRRKTLIVFGLSTFISLLGTFSMFYLFFVKCSMYNYISIIYIKYTYNIYTIDIYKIHIELYVTLCKAMYLKNGWQGMIFAFNYHMFIICTSMMGFFFSCLGSYTLPMELSPPNKRWLVGTCTVSAWSVGTGWYTLTAYLVRDWKTALQLNSIPFLILTAKQYNL